MNGSIFSALIAGRSRKTARRLIIGGGVDRFFIRDAIDRFLTTMNAASSTVPVVLITGALTGIGRATVLVFAREGAKQVVSGRRATEGTQLAGEIIALGHGGGVHPNATFSIDHPPPEPHPAGCPS